MASRRAICNSASVLAGLLRHGPVTSLLEIMPGASGAFRQSSTNSSTAHSILPMPKLSPEMTKGTLLSWHKKQGESYNQYDVLISVAAEEADLSPGVKSEPVTMLIEAQDAGVLANILVTEGQQVCAGTPLAVVTESKEDAEKLKQHVPRTTDVYDQSQEQVHVMMIQMYRKHSKAPVGKGK